MNTITINNPQANKNLYNFIKANLGGVRGPDFSFWANKRIVGYVGDFKFDHMIDNIEVFHSDSNDYYVLKFTFSNCSSSIQTPVNQLLLTVTDNGYEGEIEVRNTGLNQTRSFQTSVNHSLAIA
ncbi:MAG: hypothetical protein ACRCXZ_09780 [Patescibacteria group bacterium]